MNYNLYSSTRKILSVLARALVNLEISNTQYLPLEGPTLIVTNHINMLDSAFAMIALPYPVTTLVKWEYRKHPFLGWFLPLFSNTIWVRRGRPDLEALRKAIDLLKDGGTIAIAPEGTRSHTGIMMEARSGAAFLAAKTDALLVPVAIYGQEKVFARPKNFRRPDIYIRFGPPFRLPPVVDENHMEQLRANTRCIMHNIADLLPEQYRGIWDYCRGSAPDH